jgi:hypothetical protein
MRTKKASIDDNRYAALVDERINGKVNEYCILLPILSKAKDK